LPGTSRLRIFYLTHLSAPAADRPIYRAIHRHKVQHILELGLGDGQRALRMIEVAAHCIPLKSVFFTGIDPFEADARPNGPGLTLKMAHRLLKSTGARIQLVPGDPFTALARSADRLGPADLVVLSAGLDPESVQRAWFYLPRLTHAGTQVFVESKMPGGVASLELLTHQDVQRRAVASVMRRAA
jgi:hypothetical protein